MALRTLPITLRLVERLKAAQIAMFGDPSHGGRLHEETIQTAHGPQRRWVAGEAAPKPKAKAGPQKTPEKGKDPNDKRTIELDDLIGIHRKAQAIPRGHIYQAALGAWHHDPEARERYKEAMAEDTTHGEGPAHQRLRLWWAKGAFREAHKGLDDASFFEAVRRMREVLKAKAKGDTATLDMFSLMGPSAPKAAPAPAPAPAPATDAGSAAGFNIRDMVEQAKRLGEAQYHEGKGAAPAQSAGFARLMQAIPKGPEWFKHHAKLTGAFSKAWFDLHHAATSPVATDEPTHGGRLHQEMRTDKTGRTQTRWVGQPEPATAHQEPAAPKPAATPKATSPKAAGGQAEAKKKPASDWPTTPPDRNDVAGMTKWMAAAPPGARMRAGSVSLEKREVDLPKVGGIWRVSGSRDTISSESLAVQMGPALEPDDEGNDREWERYFRKPSPKDLAGQVTASVPGDGHIHIEDPVIQAEIPTAYVDRFEAAVDKLQKRAARLGLQPLTFEKTGNGAQTVVVGQPPDIITRVVPTTTFTVVMPDLALPGGWKFIGAVEHGENGNKVHFRHKPDNLDTRAFRLHESTCDHCKTNRQRKLTVVIQNRDGETKRVGSDCMKDYLGHDVPLSGWSTIYDQMQADLYGELDEAWSEGAVKNATGATTEDYMAAVARNIREAGRYVPRRGSDENETPTADAAWAEVTNRKGDPSTAGSAKMRIAEEDRAAAARVIAWARAIPHDTTDDFLHNVRVAVAGETVVRSDAGFAAAAFSAMRRDNAKRGIVEPGQGRRVGNVGDKIGTGKGYAIAPIVGTVIHRSDHRSDFGWSSLVKIKGDDGNVYTTFASNPNYTNMGQQDSNFLTSYGLIPKRAPGGPFEGSPDTGDRVRIHGGSIKKHETFRGEPQNVLTRTKLERIDIPDYSAAKLPVSKEQAPNARGVMVNVENPWREHEIAFMDHASAEAQRQGHMPGDEGFAAAFTHELKAAKERWPHDFGAHHYVYEDRAGAPTTHNDRITEYPRTEVGLLNHLRAQQRNAREYGLEWRWPSADEYRSLLDQTLERGRKYPSQHGSGEALKALAPHVGPPPARNRETHPFVGTIRIHGLPTIRVETRKGEERSGVDPDGNAWSVTMPAHYGEFHGTRGVDGDPVDVFVGPDVHAPFAYVFHMSKLGAGGYDEDKVAVGFPTRQDAERCLRDAYDRPGLFHAAPKRLTIAELAHWLAQPENKGQMLDAGREMAKAVPVTVLSLTGAPPRVVRVQAAPQVQAPAQALAETIREGDDVPSAARTSNPACAACAVPMDALRGPPWASVYACPLCHEQTRIPKPNYQRPDDAPAPAPEVCKDAYCTDPTHGHEREVAKAHREGLVLEHVARADGREQGYWKRPGGPVEAGPMGGGGGISTVVTVDDIKAALGDWYRPPGGTISGGAGDVFGGAAEILGRPAHEIDLLAACGATHGDDVEATRYPGQEPPAIELVVNPCPPERGIQAIRWLKGDDGSPVIVNDVIMAFPPGQKLGLAAFASQVVNVERLGIRRIEAYAARGETWVGFDVWHKMGYLPVDDEAPITEALATHVGNPDAAAELTDAGFDPATPLRLTSMLSTQAGAAWWSKFGVGYHAAFDLTPGSTCMRTLHAYTLSKKREADARNDPNSAPTV